MKKIIILGALTLSACSTTPVQLPSNVSLIPQTFAFGIKANAINEIKYSTDATNLPEKKLQLCAIESLSNDDVRLKETDSYFGSFTGRSYNFEKSDTVRGGQVIKALSDGVMLAQGNTKTQKVYGMLSYFVKYNVKVTTGSSGTDIVFYNVAAAQQDTGYADNDGFGPVGTYPNGYAQPVYDAVNTVGMRLKNCLS